MRTAQPARHGPERGLVISFVRLGDYGRLGNQMFQYAAVKAVSIKLGYEARIPRYPGLDLIEVFDIPEAELTEADAATLEHTYAEPQFTFSDSVFAIPDSCNLHGYFQSEKYFEHCTSEIRASFAFKRPLKAQADAASKRLFGTGWLKATLVSLHVRRGDYLSKPGYHPTCGKEYYDRALDHLEREFGRLRVVVFSDDIAWCRKTFRGMRYRFATGNDHGTDMLLMSRCEHHVIANSSFSWWAAWLNPSPDKIVIAPADWFGPECREDTRDLVPQSWLRM